MCHFISLVAAEQPPALIPSGARSVAVEFSPRSHPALRPHLLPGEAVYWAGVHCDCGTALGARRRGTERNAARLAQMEQNAEKLRKEGWSTAKIKRWMDEKSASLKRTQGDEEDELHRWAALLGQTVSRKHSMGLFLAWESGRRDEQVPVRAESVALSKVTPDWLAQIEENVLYRIHTA